MNIEPEIYYATYILHEELLRNMKSDIYRQVFSILSVFYIVKIDTINILVLLMKFVSLAFVVFESFGFSLFISHCFYARIEALRRSE
jgi:hypothetical protein